jgi:hypothetical protein
MGEEGALLFQVPPDANGIGAKLTEREFILIKVDAENSSSEPVKKYPLATLSPDLFQRELSLLAVSHRWVALLGNLLPLVGFLGSSLAGYLLSNKAIPAFGGMICLALFIFLQIGKRIRITFISDASGTAVFGLNHSVLGHDTNQRQVTSKAR